MTAAVVIANLLYLIGAVVVIVIGALLVTLRHRKPTSVEANMATFHKGLRALSPETQPVRRRHAPAAAPVSAARTTRARTVHTVLPAGRDTIDAPGPGHPSGDDTTTEAETG